ncbi:hypothetical protein AM433_002141 [Pseudomonas aeruginosa]|nr:hypothetical protein AM433_002141 [Pseudomonas aeruginosa]
MQSLEEIQQRTDQTKKLTGAIRRWNAMNEQYADLRRRIDEINEEREVLRVDRPEFCRHSVAALRVAPFKLYR